MGDKKVTLKLEKVSKSFAKIETDEVTHALNEIDLTLNSGEFISLVGPSGCGKSTILRLVAGLIVPTKGTVSVDGKEVKLTPTEYNILKFLTKNKGKVFSIEDIYTNVWDGECYAAENVIAVHIRHIREKIEINPKEPKYLKVIWGIGYKVEAL